MHFEGIQRGLKDRRDRKRAQHDGSPVAIPSFQGEGPKQVKLFFDVSYDRCPKIHGRAMSDVRDGEQGRGNVEPSHLLLVGIDYDRQKHQGGGKATEGAAQVEILQAHCRGALVLVKQKIRNQVTGNHKKNEDAERSVTAEHFQRNVLPLHQVTQNHQRDGNRAQAV